MRHGVFELPSAFRSLALAAARHDFQTTKRELKYLVIDYTQFEEWSSEEEILFNNGESPVPHIFLVWTVLKSLGAVPGPKR